MKEITITKYEANDGTRFDLKNECERYEKDIARNELVEAVSKIPHTFVPHEDIFPSGNYDDYMVMFKPTNVEQYEKLIEWCTANNIVVDVPLSSAVGRTLVISDVYGSSNIEDIDTNYVYGMLQTLDQYIGGLVRHIDSYRYSIGKEDKE